ncbi:MAG TPA: hypothetical protein DHW78_10750 [Ruminococcaceae bacterium]|jgi:membrane protein required for colicin V production|nr:hypothetical protein [Oscillospiraceae bacterium]HCM24787.1 hypothetical protein [Oscillospiraceae bacterium]
MHFAKAAGGIDMGVAIDIILIIVLIACIIAGANKGAARTLAGLVGMIAAVLLSPHLGKWLAGVIPIMKKQDPFAAKIICTILAFLLILIFAGIVGHLLTAVCRLPVLHTVNRVFGGILGGVKGVIAVMLICALLRLALPLLALKYPKNIPLSGFHDSVVLQMQEAAAPSTPNNSKLASNVKKAGTQITQKMQEAFTKLPKSVRNPVYTLYDKILRGDVKADADQK